MSRLWTAFGLTAFAGMATGIGAALAFYAKRTNYRFLSLATGFSAGVMLYVSFVEILSTGAEALAKVYGDHWSHWINAASFFGGITVIALIDSMIPSAKNPHETHTEPEIAPLHASAVSLPDSGAAVARPGIAASGSHDHRLLRMGLLTALAIAIHNVPEGLATFLSTLEDPRVGVAIAVAIALHNIPEGISVSVPIFYATGNRKKAFVYAVLSGLAEPLGAVVLYVALRAFLAGNSGLVPPHVMGMMLGGVAGVMVYISLDLLLPTSHAFGKGHDTLVGLVAGMVIMALSLLLME